MFHKDKDTLDLLNKFAQKDSISKKENSKKIVHEKKVREKVIYRDYGKINVKPEIDKVYKNFIGYGFLFLFLASMYIMISKNTKSTNPIIGTWRTDFISGFIEIEFKENKAYAFGESSNVKYEIEKNKITVIDTDARMGTVYYLINENSMVTNSFGVKTAYKRVDK